MTYAEFGTMIHETAAAFNAMNLVGEKIVVIGDNSPRWLCTYLAALASGCVIVPMDNAGCAEGIAALLGDPERMARLSACCAGRNYANGQEADKLTSIMDNYED